MPDPQQQQRFSDDEMAQLANDPTFTDADWKLLSEPERMRFLKAKSTRIGSTPAGPDAANARPFQMPMPLAPPPSQGEPLNLFGSIAKVPGTWESALPAPLAFIDSFLPQAKPLTIPLAGLLGGVGSVADDFRAGTPLDVGSFIGGAGRQSALEAVGRMIGGPVAKGVTKLGLPGADKAAVQAAVDLGPFRSANSARDAATTAGRAISERLDSFGPVTIPKSDLFSGADAVAQKAVNRSLAPRTTGAAFRSEVGDSLGQLPDQLTPQRVNQIKQGAREGYTQLQRRKLQGAAITPGDQVQQLAGNNAQRLLETLDDQLRPNGATSLADINQKSGGLQSLLQYMGARGNGNTADGLLGRMALGSVVGGLAAAPFTDSYSRYGAASLPTALAFGLAPTLPGRMAQVAGAALPPLARGTTLMINSLRQQPDTDATPADPAAPNVRRRQPR
jgi:hypothetical protein